MASRSRTGQTEATRREARRAAVHMLSLEHALGVTLSHAIRQAAALAARGTGRAVARATIAAAAVTVLDTSRRRIAEQSASRWSSQTGLAPGLAEIAEADRRRAQEAGKGLAKHWAEAEKAARKAGSSTSYTDAARQIEGAIKRTATTETVDAWNQQIAKQGRAARRGGASIRYTWEAEHDKRTCSLCASLDGAQWKDDEAPPDGWPPLHPHCRCHVVTDIIRRGDEDIAPPPPARAKIVAKPKVQAKPKAPKKSAKPAAFTEGVHAKRILVEDKADAALAAAALAQQPKGVLRMLERHPLQAIEFRTSANMRETPGSEAYGLYFSEKSTWDPRNARMVRIDAQLLRASVLRFEQYPKWSITHAVASGKDLSLTEARDKAAAVTITHELGHHLHLGIPGDRYDVDRAIQIAWEKRVAAGVSEYASTNHVEYFAESFAAYHHAPERLDDVSREMVEKVLRLRGVPRGAPR